MPRKYSADVVTTNMRIPKKLHGLLEQAAIDNTQSMNSEIMQRLKDSFEDARLNAMGERGFAQVQQGRGELHRSREARSLRNLYAVLSSEMRDRRGQD
jgi:hypothetical protein